MYEKVFGILMFGVYMFSIVLVYFQGRRERTSEDIPGTGDLEQRAAELVDGARADNNRAAEQNRDLRDNSKRAEELIKRGKEILNMGEDSE